MYEMDIFCLFLHVTCFAFCSQARLVGGAVCVCALSQTPTNGAVCVCALSQNSLAAYPQMELSVFVHSHRTLSLPTPQMEAGDLLGLPALWNLMAVFDSLSYLLFFFPT